MSEIELKQFAEDLHQETLAAAGDEENPRLREEVFTEQVLQDLIEHNEIDSVSGLCAFEAPSAGRTPAAKLNGWRIDSEGATLDLFITLYHGTGDCEAVGIPTLRRHFELVGGFLQRALDGAYTKMEESSTAFIAAKDIHDARETLSTVRLVFITDGLVRNLDLEAKPIAGLAVEYAAWDLQKLSQLRVGERSTIELDFASTDHGALACIEAEDGTGEYRTFLAFLPAVELAKIYGLYGQRLLERNVRAFLQARGKVNRGLRQTLTEEPSRFLAYNNGLCCTASDVRLVTDGVKGLRLEWAKDFQIVNGGQTTASIFHAWKKQKCDISAVTVQMKLTVISDPANVPTIVPLISKYANSQNKVNAADFAAHGPFHIKLEELSRTIWAPAKSGMERGTRWYYERARGSYLDDKGRQGTPAQRRNWETQHPTKQKFTKTDLAKFVHAWTGAPHHVCLGAEKCFQRFAEQMEKVPDLIPDEETFKRIIALAILFRTTEQVVSAHRFGGWRANITAYTVGRLADYTQQRLDLARVWQQQGVDDDIIEALNSICVQANEHLIKTPLDRRNVGEWSKQEKCWTAFRSTGISVPRTITTNLVAKEDVWDFWRGFTFKTAEEEKQVVMAVSADYWFTLAKWAKEHDVLEPKQRSISVSLGRLALGRREPSPRQIDAAIKILRDAGDEGFELSTSDDG